MSLLTIIQLSEELGVTVRQLEEDVKDGLPVSKVGPRKVRLFDAKVAKQWRRTNRRQVFGEGRSRSVADLKARARRLLTGDPGGDGQGSKKREPPPDLADLDHNQILRLVMEGKLDQAHARAYMSGIDAMERGLEFRARTMSVVDAADLERTTRSAATAARLVIENGVDAIVAAVAEVVTLTDAQRHAVRAAAEANARDTMRELAAIGTRIKAGASA